MDKHIEELYARTPRFDESDLCQDPDYKLREKVTLLMEENTELQYGKEIRKLLTEYMLSLHECCHYEFLYYFEQGYLAGQGEAGKAG